jgi:hypothetical protein
MMLTMRGYWTGRRSFLEVHNCSDALALANAVTHAVSHTITYAVTHAIAYAITNPLAYVVTHTVTHRRAYRDSDARIGGH